jgi:hypothetical protein
MRTSNDGSPFSDTGSERPVPRLSNRITRENDARRSTNRAIGRTSHMASTLETHPWTHTRSSGPSPTIWYAMWRSPLMAYRVSGITRGPQRSRTNRRRPTCNTRPESSP